MIRRGDGSLRSWEPKSTVVQMAIGEEVHFLEPWVPALGEKWSLALHRLADVGDAESSSVLSPHEFGRRWCAELTASRVGMPTTDSRQSV